MASPRRRQLGQAPGDDRGPGVVAGAEAVGHARGDGHDVLERPGHLAPDDVGVGVHAEQLAGEDALQLAGRCGRRRRPPRWRRRGRPGSPWPGWGRSARPPGGRAAPRSMTSVMRRWLPSSSPLARLTTGTQGRTCGGQLAQRGPHAVRGHAHDQHVGVADRLLAATRWPPAPRAGRSPARYSPLRWWPAISSASSGRRAHSMVGALREASAATVVPHDPAPTTATRMGMRVTVVRRPWHATWPSSPIGPGGTLPRQCHRRRPRRWSCRSRPSPRPRCGWRARSTPPSAPTWRATWPRSCCWPPTRCPSVVVCDDDEVRAWAERSGARVVWCPGRGLNGAVADGVAALRADGVERAVVAHADLPLATRLDWVADFPGVTLVPDRRFDGTNVLAAADRRRLPLQLRRRVVRPPPGRGGPPAGCPPASCADPQLAWDVDLPADLAYPAPDCRLRRPRQPRPRSSRPRRAPPPRPRPPPAPVAAARHDRHRARPAHAGERAGHRRPPRRRRVRLRGHAGEVGGRRLRGQPPGLHRRVEGHLGPRPGPCRPGRPAPGRAAGRGQGARGHRRGGVPRAGPTASSSRACASAGRWRTGSGGCAPTSCWATTRGSATGCTPTTATPAS